MVISFNSLLGRLLISTLLSSSSGVLSCSFVWNIFLCHLILPNSLFYFYVLGRSVMFPDLEEVDFYRRHHIGPGKTLPSVHQSYIL